MESERNCNACIWSTRDGNCSSWECEFVRKREAYNAWKAASALQLVKDGTLIVSTDKETLDNCKRVMVVSGVWCKTFYEEGNK